MPKGLCGITSEANTHKSRPRASFSFLNKYILRYFYKKIYLCDYLPDGLSLNSVRMRMKSPVSACICYSDMVKYPIPFMQKVKAAINYWRFWFCESQHKKPSLPCTWWWCLPMGIFMHLKDKR